MNVILKTFILWSLCQTLLLCTTNVLAEVNAWLDRQIIAEGETVNLLIEAQGRITAQPDTEPLRKDFDVLGVSTGSRVNIVNGQVDARTTWTVSLSPKHGGTIRIPALTLGKETTPALSLQIRAAPAPGAASGSPIFIETEVEPTSPYVQSMVIYTVRLLYTMQIVKGDLSEPSLDAANVRRLGKDQQYSTQRNGRLYQVIERRYAIFPQSSGELTIPASIFTGQIPDRRKQRRSFGGLLDNDQFFGRDPFDEIFTATRTVRVRGKEKTLQVKTRPASSHGRHWLPAQSIQLTESWDPQSGEIRVGDPITRTINLLAQGLTAAQLPDLTPPAIDGANVYPDRAKTHTEDLQDTVIGERIRQIALIPTQPGTLELPAIRLYWWDTEADQERTAEIPARFIEILPAAGQVSDPQDLVHSKTFPQEIQQPTGEGVNPDTLNPGINNSTPVRNGYWPWLTGLVTIGWLLTLLLWWRGRQKTSGSDTRILKTSTVNTSQPHKRFVKACRNSDPKEARSALMYWARTHWSTNPPNGLEEIASRIGDAETTQELIKLDRALYLADEKNWDGAPLARKLKHLPKACSDTNTRQILPDLYA